MMPAGAECSGDGACGGSCHLCYNCGLSVTLNRDQSKDLMISALQKKILELEKQIIKPLGDAVTREDTVRVELAQKSPATSCKSCENPLGLRSASEVISEQYAKLANEYQALEKSCETMAVALKAMSQVIMELFNNCERSSNWYTDGITGKEKHALRWYTDGTRIIKQALAEHRKNSGVG